MISMGKCKKMHVVSAEFSNTKKKWDNFRETPVAMDPSGWWLTYPSEKYEFVSWDDDISN